MMTVVTHNSFFVSCCSFRLRHTRAVLLHSKSKTNTPQELQIKKLIFDSYRTAYSRIRAKRCAIVIDIGVPNTKNLKNWPNTPHDHHHRVQNDSKKRMVSTGVEPATLALQAEAISTTL
jgi:hypothetical protein